MNSPSGALSKNDESGVSLLCTAGCAYAGIVYEAAVGHVTKCDMCDGDPACVKACRNQALELRTTARIFNAYADKEDQRTVDDKIAFLRKLAEMVPAQGPVSPN